MVKTKLTGRYTIQVRLKYFPSSAPPIVGPFFARVGLVVVGTLMYNASVICMGLHLCGGFGLLTTRFSCLLCVLLSRGLCCISVGCLSS